MVELVYETHALTTDNEYGIATGWLPGELSDEGRLHAVSLGRRRADVAAVFASDLRRAVETAKIAFAESSVPVLLDWRLRECDYGDLNGAPVASLDRAAHVDEPFPNGESFRDVVGRTASFISDVRERWRDTRICVISHSANLWAFQHLLEGAPLPELVAAPFEWREGWEFRL